MSGMGVVDNGAVENGDTTNKVYYTKGDVHVCDLNFCILCKICHNRFTNLQKWKEKRDSRRLKHCMIFL